MSGLPAPETFLSGQTGHVAGLRRVTLRRAGDALLDLRLAAMRRRLDGLAAETPRRSIVAACVHRPGAGAPALTSARHDVHMLAGSTSELGGGGKFQNLQALLGGPPDADWLIVVDDDVELPSRFLDRFLGVCEHVGLALAQPAQTLSSHAAWPVTRRRGGVLARETRFVEIGPVTAFRRDVAEALMPFPPLRYGWGLDLHWSAVAEERGWALGVIDATPVRHEGAPVASSYPAEEAIAEAQRFLAQRPHLTAGQAGKTVAVHR